MRVIRGREDARWMPSRFRFALFRLYAYARLRGAAPQSADVAYIIDRDQSAVENFTVGIWTIFSAGAYVTWLLSPRWPLALALIASPFIAVMLMQVPVVAVGLLLLRRKDNLRVNSVVLMVLLTAAAVYFARVDGWVRYAAWQFLGVLALNALAAIVVMIFRSSIAAAESTLGGLASDL
jgi:hypothetical protein